MPLRTPQTVTARIDESRRKANPAKLAFPVDGAQAGYGMLFKIQQYNFEWDPKTAGRPAKFENDAHIFLPMPAQLQESQAAEYSAPEMGMARFGLISGQDAANALNTGGVEGMLNSIGRSATNVGEYLLRSALNKASPELGALVNAQTGTVPNPYSTVQFSRMNQRTHQFEWKLSPTCKEDSDALFDIVNTFKYYSLPKMDGIYLRFPHEFEIAFIGSPQLYGISKCVLTDISVNYMPHGQPSFFAMSGAPTAVQLTLSFREIEPLSKDALEGTQYKPKAIQVGDRSGVQRQDNILAARAANGITNSPPGG